MYSDVCLLVPSISMSESILFPFYKNKSWGTPCLTHEGSGHISTHKGLRSLKSSVIFFRNFNKFLVKYLQLGDQFITEGHSAMNKRYGIQTRKAWLWYWKSSRTEKGQYSILSVHMCNQQTPSMNSLWWCFVLWSFRLQISARKAVNVIVVSVASISPSGHRTGHDHFLSHPFQPIVHNSP